MAGVSKQKEFISAPVERFLFGDQRLSKRASYMVEQMEKRVGNSLPKTFCDQADLRGAYRFLSNDRVTPDKILSPHSEQTIKRCGEYNLVAVLQDSSDLSFDYMQELEGFNPMQSHVNKGYRIHPSLAVTEDGTALGVLGTSNYTRDLDKPPTKERNSLPIEEKESYRWLSGYRLACELAKKIPETTVVSISDREGDIYECLAEAEHADLGLGAHLLVRSNHNRNLAGEQDNTTKKLEQKLTRASVMYEATVSINADRKSAREAHVAVRACSLQIQSPRVAKKKKLDPVAVNAILVSEVEPPQGVEPLHWLLLTTLPIETHENIQRVVSLYSQRWKIEVYFKVLKSGMGIDSRFLRTKPRIENYIALAMIVGWRVMLTTYLPRENPDAPCTILFSETEWKLAYLGAYKRKRPLPNNTPTLKEAIVLVAILGGYQKRKSPPGTQAIWSGMERLMDMIWGHDLMTSITGVTHD